MILAGDVGGTKCILAALEAGPEGLRSVHEETLPSREHPSLESVVLEFLGLEEVCGHRSSLRAACFGVAGPVVDAKVTTPNLPWAFSEASLQQASRIPRVRLINDLEAAGYGIDQLGPHELLPLNPGQASRGGARVLVSAGTGLGEAILVAESSGSYRPIPSEGGHTDFAPRTEQEINLLRYLLRFWDHVSYERVLSGPGLQNVYSFLRDSGGSEEAEIAALIEGSKDPSAQISQAALAGQSPLCHETLRLFASVYGAEAGNLALKAKATGGVYLGGGIAPKIQSLLTDGTFMEAFHDKGRMQPLMESMPVHAVLNSKLGLIGAAAFAASMEEGS